VAYEDAIEFLLVEDNPTDAELTLRALRGRGLRNSFVLAKDGQQALDFLFAQGEHAGRDVRNGPKLVMLDLRLPKVDGIEVPYWERMLLTAARSYEMTGMGYTGVDQVIDRDRGPVLLELNARPGLAVQIANRAGLWGRLRTVEQAPPAIFETAEARVAWARKTFRPAA